MFAFGYSLSKREMGKEWEWVKARERGMRRKGEKWEGKSVTSPSSCSFLASLLPTSCLTSPHSKYLFLILIPLLLLSILLSLLLLLRSLHLITVLLLHPVQPPLTLQMGIGARLARAAAIRGESGWYLLRPDLNELIRGLGQRTHSTLRYASSQIHRNGIKRQCREEGSD